MITLVCCTIYSIPGRKHKLRPVRRKPGSLSTPDRSRRKALKKSYMVLFIKNQKNEVPELTTAKKS